MIPSKTLKEWKEVCEKEGWTTHYQGGDDAYIVVACNNFKKAIAEIERLQVLNQNTTDRYFQVIDNCTGLEIKVYELEQKLRDAGLMPKTLYEEMTE